MTTKLSQKHILKGTRKFEIEGDSVHYQIKSPLKTEALSVVLHVLDSKPVVSSSLLSFVSCVNREPLVELFLNNPDKETFDAFVTTMKLRIHEDNFSRLRVKNKVGDVDELNTAIEMLHTYLNTAEIEPLLGALEALKAKPEDEKCLGDLADAFNNLGFEQGQVLTYAPYISFLLAGVTEHESHKDTYR